MSLNEEHKWVVSSFLGREVSDGELLTDVILETLAALATRVEALEQS